MSLTNSEKKSRSNRLAQGFALKRKYLAIPYGVFLILFVIIPILLIIAYAFSETQIAMDGSKTTVFSFAAAASFFSNPSKWSVLFVSLFIGIQTTIICLLLSYPAAYFLAEKKFKSSRVLVLLFIMPMWINFVIRTGATRDLLNWMGLSGSTHPWGATIIGMVYNYLPFTILPLYTTMLKLDHAQMEAASDLGGTPWQVFWKNVVPQSLPGIVSACEMVFMPVMSSYVISDTLSEGKITLFGNYIYLAFSNSLWNEGSFMALIMLAIIAVTMLLTRNVEKDPSSVRGGGLW